VSTTAPVCPTSASVLVGSVVGVMCFTMSGRSQMIPTSDTAENTTSCALGESPSAAAPAVTTVAGAKAPMKKPAVRISAMSTTSVNHSQNCQ
jgi:hypothetical protein